MPEPKPSQRIIDLAQKWKDKAITVEEQAEFDRWFDGHDDSMLQLQSSESVDIGERMYQAILAQADIPLAVPSVVRRLTRVAAAAAVILIVCGSIFLYFDNRSNGAETGADATLYTTISTPRGGSQEMTLPDGTKVTLNAASSLRYPMSFNDHERKVVLHGEAWFDVSPEKNRPFTILTGGQAVEVLGTQLNINGYDDEPSIRTTLLSGSIRIGDTAMHSRSLLKPGQQALFTTEGIAVKRANMDEAIAWKNGDFLFESEDIHAVMRKLARWYDIDIVYSGEIPTDTFEGAMKRYLRVEQVLHKLSLTNKVHFRVEGRSVIVSR